MGTDSLSNILCYFWNTKWQTKLRNQVILSNIFLILLLYMTSSNVYPERYYLSRMLRGRIPHFTNSTKCKGKILTPYVDMDIQLVCWTEAPCEGLQTGLTSVVYGLRHLLHQHTIQSVKQTWSYFMIPSHRNIKYFIQPTKNENSWPFNLFGLLPGQ